MTGIAIEFGDQKYTEPNRTLMSFTEGTMKSGKEKGLKKEVKGYWGDIVSSPFFSLPVPACKKVVMCSAILAASSSVPIASSMWPPGGPGKISAMRRRICMSCSNHDSLRPRSSSLASTARNL